MPVPALASPTRCHSPVRPPCLAMGRLALAAAAVAALAACTRADNFAPPCPEANLATDASVITRVVGSGRDVTDLALEARIIPSTGSCQWTDKSHARVTTTIQVPMSFTRGPAMSGRTVTIPYFIAVSEGETRILEKEVYNMQVTFPANADRITGSTPPITMVFPVSPQKPASFYQITIGFQLSPEELHANQLRAAH